MPTVSVLSGDKMKVWDEFVASHVLGTIYHTSHWLEVIKNAYGHQTNYFVLDDENGAIKAGLPVFIITGTIMRKRMVSLPCAQYCNPLVKSQDDYDLLIEYVIDFINKNNISCLEVKSTDKFAFHNKKLGEAITRYSTYLLDIDRPLDTVISTFHKSCIQQHIKKSYYNGLKLKTAQNYKDMKCFYRLYLNMRKQNGLLPQPYIFFLSLWETMSKENNIEVLFAEYNDEIISAVLLLKYKDTVIYEYGATNPEMLHLKPSHFLLWEAIQRSQLQGYKKFDFGRTSDDNVGLSLFKSRWGTTREALSYHYIPDIKSVAKIRQNNASKMIMRCVLRSTPAPLSQWMGRLIYRYIV